MARVKGPLMSGKAAGNFAGGLLQFRGGLQGTHVHMPRTPYQTSRGQPSEAQQQHRAKYRAAREAWQALNEEQRQQWNDRARATGQPVSGWNLYLTHHIQGSGTEPPPVEEPPPPEPPPPADYTPPAGHAVAFQFGEEAYTPPAGHAVNFQF